MMVTFISQCEKKALNKSRRVLDAFANRIGDNTWQTVITNEGLLAVKKLLRKTATKNTAVSCFWIRSRARSELVWIVGSKQKFNKEGIVPVNRTGKDILKTEIENDWECLPLIKCLTALSALFHDWGKASACFQAKLKSKKIMGDPIRHEWVSCLFFHAFVNAGNNISDDSDWLTRLSNGELNEKNLQKILVDNKNKTPLKKLPPIASMIAWLILSHHRLPAPTNINKEEQQKLNRKYKTAPLPDYHQLFDMLNVSFGYENPLVDIDVSQCLSFLEGLPSQSQTLMSEIRHWSNITLKQKGIAESSIENGVWRLVLHHARLSLMLGDHWYSSQNKDTSWQPSSKLIANTDRETKKPKQYLDEHLVGVAKSALKTARLLPDFENTLPYAKSTKAIIEKSPKDFKWQNTAVDKINKWSDKELKPKESERFGFFAVNMASTGKGKTFANAKIINALSGEEGLRYILALGLRTLTLQTGDEYKERIKLKNRDLAVFIGSKAVTQLHDFKKTEGTFERVSAEDLGSESLENLLDGDFEYDCDLPAEGLTTVLSCEKDRKFLYAPIMVCTIDHIISATQTKRGGRYILPSLRLMSSDLVIDEIDDFDGDDLIAIGRLIHLAGMLGRKVMISSATIPPDLALGYFNAYQQGWQVFAKSRSMDESVGCAWIDEFTTNVQTISISAKIKEDMSFADNHTKFIAARISKIKAGLKKRQADIIKIIDNKDDESTKQTHYFKCIQQEIINKHLNNFTIDKHNTNKQVSFGVVRVANISPCVMLAEYFMECEWPEDIAVKVMPYHSQQVLLMRSAQEKHLDEVLKRKDQLQVFEHGLIKSQLESIKEQNVIYILVATPVEEVGRDHCFDWAIIEPSSYRSFIQLVGRVLRHREVEPKQSNIALMEYNLKGYKQYCSAVEKRKAVFNRPGYEKDDTVLQSHSLFYLINESVVNQSIDAIPRISRNADLKPQTNLVDLEHFSIEKLLATFEDKGPESMEGWLSQCWWLTALPQTLRPFRQGVQNVNLFLVPKNPDDAEIDFVFMEKDDKGYAHIAELEYGITHQNQTFNHERLWLVRDYESLLKEVEKRFSMEEGMNLRRAALRFGEISLPLYGGEFNYYYNEQFGLLSDSGVKHERS